MRTCLYVCVCVGVCERERVEWSDGRKYTKVPLDSTKASAARTTRTTFLSITVHIHIVSSSGHVQLLFNQETLPSSINVIISRKDNELSRFFVKFILDQFKASLGTNVFQFFIGHCREVHWLGNRPGTDRGCHQQTPDCEYCEYHCCHVLVGSMVGLEWPCWHWQQRIRRMTMMIVLVVVTMMAIASITNHCSSRRSSIRMCNKECVCVDV